MISLKIYGSIKSAMLSRYDPRRVVGTSPITQVTRTQTPAPSPMIPTRPMEVRLTVYDVASCTAGSSINGLTRGTQAEGRIHQRPASLANVLIWLGYLGGQVQSFRADFQPPEAVWPGIFDYSYCSPPVQIPIGARIIAGVTNLPSGYSLNAQVVQEWPPQITSIIAILAHEIVEYGLEPVFVNPLGNV